MLVTAKEATHQRVLFLRDHGRAPGEKLFWNAEVAYKYKMSSLQAALGLAQLERIDELIARKLEIFAWYEAELSGVEGITINHKATHTKNTYWMNTVILDPTYNITKEKLIVLMKENGIACRPLFYPLSSLPAYQHLEQARIAQDRNRISYRISPYGINLPSSLTLTRGDVQRVCDTLKSIIETHGK